MRLIPVLLLALLVFGCMGQQISGNENISSSKGNASQTNSAMLGQDESIVQNLNMTDVKRTEQLNGNNATMTPPNAYNFSITHDPDGKLIVYYFSSSSGCKPCNDMAQLEKELKEKYGDRTIWREFDLQKPEQGAVYWSFASFRKLPICLEKVPAAYVDNNLLVGFAVNDSLEKAINQSLASTD